MQYLTIITLVAAAIGGVQAGDPKPSCGSRNSNFDRRPFNKDNFSGKKGDSATVQQACADMANQFGSGEEKWDCRKRGDVWLKTRVQNTGNAGKLDVESCKKLVDKIVMGCDDGGLISSNGWEFQTGAWKTTCGK